MTEDRKVRDLLRRYQEAINQKDAEATVACYADDVVAYDLAPPLAQDAHVVCDPNHVQQWSIHGGDLTCWTRL